ncbi:MAG: magnesium transporter [Erysipelotrichaceae bacterium]|nr:magnesium transporter [Erysipelotrichaceae bacterium]
MDREDFVETYGFNLADLNQLLKEKKYRAFTEKLNDLNEADIADYIESLAPEMRLLVFRMLHKDIATDVFSFLEVDVQEGLINEVNDKELSSIVEELNVDDAVDMLEELPAIIVNRVLQNAKPETRKLINQFLKYPEDSAGSIMTAEFLSVKRRMTVKEAFDYIREHADRTETIYVLYVTDSQRHLKGVLTVKDLLMSPMDAVLNDIMEDNVIKCETIDDQEEVADLFTHYDLLSIPVVDQENRLVGIVTVDDIVDVIEDEATEDIEKMAAIVPTEREYFQVSVIETWKSRIPWLMLLMVSATFTGIIINSFEEALAACVALTGFIPMLMDTSGNCGSQASVTVIRALSLGDVEFKDIAKVVFKEVRVAFLCGVSLSAVNFLKIFLIDHLLFHNASITLMVDLVVCLTLCFTIICAKFVGCTLPMIADKLGFDPAVMASPFITTIVDAVSLLIYFTFAIVLLGI